MYTSRAYECSEDTTPVYGHEHRPCSPLSTARVHRPCSRVLGTHYLCSRPVITGSVYRAKHCHRQKAFHPQSANSDPPAIDKFGLKMPIHTQVEPKTHVVTCSSVTGQRLLPFSYRNLGNIRRFYSRNGKSHKNSVQDGHTVGSSSNRRKA